MGGHLRRQAAGAAAAGHGAEPGAGRVHGADGQRQRGRAGAAPGEQLAGQLAGRDDRVQRRQRQLRQPRAQDACARGRGRGRRSRARRCPTPIPLRHCFSRRGRANMRQAHLLVLGQRADSNNPPSRCAVHDCDGLADHRQVWPGRSWLSRAGSWPQLAAHIHNWSGAATGSVRAAGRGPARACRPLAAGGRGERGQARAEAQCAQHGRVLRDSDHQARRHHQQRGGHVPQQPADGLAPQPPRLSAALPRELPSLQ